VSTTPLTTGILIIFLLSSCITVLLFTSQKQVAFAILLHVTNPTIDTARPLTPQINSVIEYDKSHLSPVEFKQKVQHIGQVFENITSYCSSSLGGLVRSECNYFVSFISLACQGVLIKENVFECSNPVVKNQGITDPGVYARYWLEESTRQNEILQQTELNSRLNSILDSCLNSLPNGLHACDRELKNVVIEVCAANNGTLDACHNGKVDQYYVARAAAVSKPAINKTR
jgi:hypothetical protein